MPDQRSAPGQCPICILSWKNSLTIPNIYSFQPEASRLLDLLYDIATDQALKGEGPVGSTQHLSRPPFFPPKRVFGPDLWSALACTFVGQSLVARPDDTHTTPHHTTPHHTTLSSRSLATVANSCTLLHVLAMLFDMHHPRPSPDRHTFLRMTPR
jgi:hypothetical protein